MGEKRSLDCDKLRDEVLVKVHGGLRRIKTQRYWLSYDISSADDTVVSRIDFWRDSTLLTTKHSGT